MLRSDPFKKKAIGKSIPLGVTLQKNGAVQFAVHAVHASTVSLCLFTKKAPHTVALEIPMNSNVYGYWSIDVAPNNIKEFSYYSYRVNGDPHLLLDPHAKAVYTSNIWGDLHRPVYFPVGTIFTESTFDWENVRAPQIPLNDLIIYEMHVRGFTCDETSDLRHPGSFLGVIEKIPYLLDLGVNAVELLPIFEFNELEYKKMHPFFDLERLYNYWGYSTVNFFSPMQRYASGKEASDPIHEFKMMVRELHRAGIEVILDVVYNHTSEGNKRGPIQSYKGLDNSGYYLLGDEGDYLNYSGCGNTFNCNKAISTQLIVDSLRFWASEMHVDGFRFDLASIFYRGEQGEVLSNPPILEEINKDPVLANVKLIAEPWDAAGLYQVGSFLPKDERWSEWNDQYRDRVRRFIKGTGRKDDFATSICGSQDVYWNKSPCRSINFITAHDGFSLADLVSYNHKHNLANGEDNRDGHNNNESWNCGVEGPTDDRRVIQLRARQMRNFCLALMISRGIPMFLMGDEYGHTRHGNNNTWCQDNELNWFLWDEWKRNQDFYRFCKLLIAFRKKYPILRKDRFYEEDEITWHGLKLGNPYWDDNEKQFLAFSLHGSTDEELYIAFNAGKEPVEVELPNNDHNHCWHWLVNTANASPEDVYLEKDAPIVKQAIFPMLSYSAIVLRRDRRCMGS